VKALKRFVVCFFVILLLVGFSFAQEKLSLEKSIEIALEKSPIVLKARADIVAAEGIAGQAVAGFLPNLSLNASVGKYYSEPMSVQMTIAGTPTVFSYGTDEQANTVSYSASLTQALFTGGKLSSSISMANKGLDAAREEHKRITQDVKFKVIEAYYGVLKANKFVDLSDESVKMAKSHLNHIQALLKVGMSTRAETLRGEVQLANADIGLTKAKQASEISKNNFNSILGVDLDAPVALADVEFEDKKVPIYNYADLLEIAYAERPDWKQYILAKEIAESEVGLARSGLWPMVSLIGNYDIGSTKYESYESDQKTWMAMLSGTWNIFDGTATWNKIKEAQGKLEANQANETEVKKGIALEVKSSNFTLKSSYENLQGTSKALELAEENFRIADLRYNSGVGSNLEAIDAQAALNQARINHLQSQHDLQIAKARVNKVLGREVY
jgi:outer membrane protein TolC